MDLSLAVKTGLYYFVDSVRTQIVVMMRLPIMGDGASVVASQTPCDRPLSWLGVRLIVGSTWMVHSLVFILSNYPLKSESIRF